MNRIKRCKRELSLRYRHHAESQPFRDHPRWQGEERDR